MTLYKIYRYLSNGLFLLFSLWQQFSRNEKFHQRMGFYPKSLIQNISGFPRIWIHAASVGEVNVAESVIKALKIRLPKCGIIVSTITAHGQNVARHKLGKDAVCIYAPLDMPGVISRAFSQIRPDIMVFLETELWPNWLAECRRLNIRTALINGRISVRSVKKYLKIRSLMQEIFNAIDIFSMIGQEEAGRIRLLGALPEKIVINGNAKYELLRHTEDSGIRSEMMRLYHIENQPVFIAGSTRRGEEKIILSAYRKILTVFPETLLIIAPRHIERTESIRKLVIREGFDCQLRSGLDNSHIRTSPVVILNTIGELQAAYSIASAVFCGGSLVPLGGQNIMEPAAWGVPIFYGPSMEDFQDARLILESLGGGMTIYNDEDLAQKVISCLSDPQKAALIGMRAKAALILHQGAADRHAEAIINLSSFQN